MTQMHPRILLVARTQLMEEFAIPISVLKFSGGEIQVRLESSFFAKKDITSITIVSDIRSSDDIMTLILATDALRRNAGASIPISLICPYLPYARQDRPCFPGEAFSLEALAGILNGQKYKSVTCLDVHSKVAFSKIENLVSVGLPNLVPYSLTDGMTTIVAPDSGASDRAQKLADSRLKNCIRLRKHRNPENGNISFDSQVESIGYSYDDPKDVKRLLVVDDICDGGVTFVLGAGLLRGLFGEDVEIHLWVTHGIFSKGVEALVDAYDSVSMANCLATGPLPASFRVFPPCGILSSAMWTEGPRP